MLVGVEAPRLRPPRPRRSPRPHRHPGAIVSGFDARLPQQHEPGGGRRGEADLHAFTVAAQRAGCGMLGGWMLRRARQPETTRPRCHQRRPRRRVRRTHGDPADDRGAAAASCSCPTRSPASGCASGSPTSARSPSGAARSLEVLDASPHRRPHIWRQADVDSAAAPAPGRRGLRPHRADAPAGAEARGADRRAEALRRRRACRSIPLHGRPRQPSGGIARGVAGRHRLAHAREPARRRRRPRRAVRGAQPLASSPVDDLPLATRRGRARRAAAARRGEPGRIDLVQPADGRVRVHPARRMRRKTRRRARRARSSPSAWASASSGWMPADSGRCTASRPRRSTAPCGVAVREAVADSARRTVTSSIPTRGTSTCTAASASSPRRSPSSAGARVTSVESDSRATEHAGENLAEWVGARAETARVDRFVSRLVADATDRERDAARARRRRSSTRRARAPDASVVEAVAALRPAAVVYVACDPVALARDVATFRDAGYDLRRRRRATTCSRTRTTSRRSRPSSAADGSAAPRR